jgi:hypothetical protein
VVKWGFKANQVGFVQMCILLVMTTVPLFWGYSNPQFIRYTSLTSKWQSACLLPSANTCTKHCTRYQGITSAFYFLFIYFAVLGTELSHLLFSTQEGRERESQVMAIITPHPQLQSPVLIQQSGLFPFLLFRAFFLYSTGALSHSPSPQS